MRLGVHVGPLSASTSTGGSRGSIGFWGWIVVLSALLLLVSWPFFLGQKQEGGNYAWVWVIAAIWWIILALVAVGLYVGKKKAAGQAAAENQQRMEKAMEEARQNGWLCLGGQTADVYAGVAPDGRICHHRHRSPEAAAECVGRLTKTA